MRAINPPQVNFTDVLNTCVGSISCQKLTQELNAINPQFNNAVQDFILKVATADLFQIPSFQGGDDDTVTGNITKKELKGLYTQHMVPERKPARSYYDQLMMSAPLRICPFCGFGHVTTLDHYLPKAKFPLLSILPNNLVPSCADCNKGKSAGIAGTKQEQCLHPYFDQKHFVDDQWLYADVQETSPPTIRYYARPPHQWHDDDKVRVQNHFIDFKLENRLRTQAGTEIPHLKGELEYDFQINQAVGVKQALQRKFNIAVAQHANCWKTAMYQALANSDWYCTGGFK
ncbi:hypothetical protein H5085_06615 [Pseudoalteromonas sp. SR43-6]|uniref:HNH endonuclease n=1 Tax=unclassified Pseudoalteromonas TaxID=194690 RepID=UPI0015FA6090|nr:MULTISPECIES: hypothetical protein [unclassified Pseudoalteromonas]MBB1288580.1 hypothetical protein [Pseudoalteromonas sp. SR41-5]MBB1373990.1 hypothetical protein [Pseudoalteromonas sp. SR43-6]MBB1413041.1 hypothetical protein [Pseudoalteromonas sp. SG43-8]